MMNNLARLALAVAATVACVPRRASLADLGQDQAVEVTASGQVDQDVWNVTNQVTPWLIAGCFVAVVLAATWLIRGWLRRRRGRCEARRRLGLGAGS